MKQTSVSEQGAGLSDLAVVAPPAGKIFNVTLVYHDPHTHTWATEVYERVRRVAGENSVRATWWKISDLAEPGVLAGAVSTAMRADVIVVAIDGEERLSLPFNVWVDTWLPNRLQGAGCLVALIGRREQANGQTNKAREYLRAVAREGRFEFLAEERRLPTEPALLFRQPVRPSRPNLYPVHVRALVGIGCGIRHRAA
jgi:hypothetical protein